MVPVNELADAWGITRGKPARLRKAGYGLVVAPKEWVESVYEGLREMGLMQCKTDPCVEARQINISKTIVASAGAVPH